MEGNTPPQGVFRAYWFARRAYRFFLVILPGEEYTVRKMSCVVVLLKDTDLQTILCEPEDIFLVARTRNAGICGVFPDQASANEKITNWYGEQSRIGRYIGDPCEA
jgi:hypothetical protein